MHSGTRDDNRESSGSPLLIVGASARAAAQWAWRRGRRPMAIDIFGDTDLQECSSISLRIPSDQYPRGLPVLARQLPPAPFVATGGLENHVEVLSALELERPNEGTGAAACALVRDPARVAAVLEAAGLPHPTVQWTAPTHGVWLEKHRKSAGGSGVRVASPHAHQPGDHYFQQFVDGVPCASVFEVIDGTAHLVGVSRQLIGLTWLNAPSFAYCGSIAPLLVKEPAAEMFERIGAVLTAAFGLRGVFGVDAVIEAESGLPSVVEVNPRYPASLDALERRDEQGAPFFGKAVLFAPANVRIPSLPLREVLGAVVDGNRIADVPRPGEVIPRGAPILTVFAPGSHDAECEAFLRTTAGAIFRLLEATVTAKTESP